MAKSNNNTLLYLGLGAVVYFLFFKKPTVPVVHPPNNTGGGKVVIPGPKTGTGTQTPPSSDF